MASSSQAAPVITAAVIGGGSMTSTTSHSQTIVGAHVFKINGFSATKDLRIGESIKPSMFRIGGHDWYIKCYPCGNDEDSAGWVTLCLGRQDDDHGSTVAGHCEFTLMESLSDGCFKKVIGHPSKLFNFEYNERCSLLGTDFIKREELEWLLEDDCFQVRCVVVIAPPPDMATETMAGSHLLTVDGGYSKTRRAFVVGEAIESSKFRVGGHSWCFEFYPWGDHEDDDDNRVSVSVFPDNPGNDEVKARFEITLLTQAGHIIATTQDFGSFSETSNEYIDSFLIEMEHESSPLLQDGIQIRCDIAVVDGITATPNLHRAIQGGQQVRGDVTFEVGGHLFAAHKCVLTTRCTAFFMAKLFGPAGKDNAGVADQHVRVDSIDPRVFEALLHFIYTDALPEVSEEDKVVIAQGLLVAADRYAMERLKLMCSDLLCTSINTARTAVTTLDLADKLGCRRLKEECIKFLMDKFAKITP